MEGRNQTGMSMTRLAYSYVRFSSKSQVRGDSLDRQLKAARAYAARNNYTLDERSYEDLGVSAFRGKNAKEGGDLRAFLDAVDDGTIPTGATLLVENFDRLSRAEVSDALELFLSITNRGVTIVTLVDERVYSKATIKANWTDLIITLATFARAHEESVIKSVRGKSAAQAAIAKGKKHAKCPFWMKASDDRMSYHVIEDKADIVRELFDLKVNGMGAHRLAVHLKKYGFKWSTPQVVRLLHNPAVIGTRISQAGREPLLDYYPPIIEKTLFYDVQRLMGAGIGTKRGRRPADEPNLFTGLVRCALCGSSMRFIRESKSVNQRYLRCLTSITHTDHCDSGFINYDAFEKEVVGWLLLDQDDEVVSLLEKKPSRKAFDAAELTSLKEQRARVNDVIVNGGMLNTSLLVQKVNAIELQIMDLEAQPPIEIGDEGEMMFAEKAWALVEKHEDAKFGDDKDVLHEVRRELKASFQRSLERINVFPEDRIGDIHYCKFSVEFRGYDGVPEREYTRPALIRVKGVWNR